MSAPELALWAKEDGTGRAYKHPFRLGPDDKPLTSPSVTTVLKLVNKEGLIQWAADQTLNWAVENASILMAKSDEAALRWGKWRWKDVRDERAEVGTGIHETIEALHTGTWNFPVLDDEQRAIMEQWELFNERYEVTPHLSEFTVWRFGEDHEHYAGTADGLWDLLDRETGELHENILIDLKTSRNTWPEHWTQVSALASGHVIMRKDADGMWAESEVTDDFFGGVGIVHLRADKHELLLEKDWDLIELRAEKFMSYRRIWQLEADEKAFLDAREKAKAVPF